MTTRLAGYVRGVAVRRSRDLLGTGVVYQSALYSGGGCEALAVATIDLGAALIDRALRHSLVPACTLWMDSAMICYKELRDEQFRASSA